MRVNAAELRELAQQRQQERSEGRDVISLLSTIERLRGYWAKAERDADYRRQFGRTLTLLHCEERWKAVQAAQNRPRSIRPIPPKEKE